MDDDVAARASSEHRRRRWPRVLAGLLAAVVLAVAGVAVWLAVGDGVRPGALDDLPDDVVVSVDERVQVVRSSGPPDLGVVLLPGWRIEAEAYVPVVAELVSTAARDGVDLVVAVPSVPLNTAFLDRGRAADARRVGEATTDEPRSGWVLGGHSLGGLIASTIVEEQPDRWAGWLSWAALVPDEVDLSGFTLPALVVAGGADDVVPVVEVERSRPRFPVDARLVVLDGMTHQQFARYASAPSSETGDATTLDALVTTTTSWLRDGVLGSATP